MTRDLRIWKVAMVGAALLAALGVTRSGGVPSLQGGPSTVGKASVVATKTANEGSLTGVPVMTPEEERAKALRYRQSSIALFTGRYMYMLINMRAPQSFDELCNGPYMPVSCDRVLVNPYTGAPMRGEPGLGEFWFSTAEADQEYGLLERWFLGKERRGHTGPPRAKVLEVAKRMRVTLDEERAKRKEYQEVGRILGGSPNLSAEEQARLASRLPLADDQKRLLVLSPAGQRAYAVGYYLMTAVSGFYEYTASRGAPRLPATLSELFSEADRIVADWVAGKIPGNPYIMVNRVAKVAILRDALINDFTGKPAQETEVPSPGNFRYFRASNGLMAVETYAENGVPASIWYVYPSFHRTSYE